MTPGLTGSGRLPILAQVDPESLLRHMPSVSVVKYKTDGLHGWTCMSIHPYGGTDSRGRCRPGGDMSFHCPAVSAGVLPDGLVESVHTTGVKLFIPALPTPAS
jgi:hypothetical protein